MIAAIILLGLRYWIDLPLWIAVGAFLLFVIKDLLLYPLLRKSYESSPTIGADQLVGLWGVAQEQIDPRGYVHVRGELWRAETESSDKPISAGSQAAEIVFMESILPRMGLVRDTEWLLTKIRG